jgi:hypothetical protein
VAITPIARDVTIFTQDALVMGMVIVNFTEKKTLMSMGMLAVTPMTMDVIGTVCGVSKHLKVLI